ncbi:MAG: ParB N-terminal domain-containing protein [Solobacterium sp.]|nr:ParB N-terminal domain-containing protein [Solobacterium sp.]MBQ6532632.1 ParB N-terminal domain-containing protein [Solobacterium sp.]MBR0213228.1 ParB N-terminal domain-containing protein [Solobacterium sp.]MBR0397559.1 ParB N-terminal domain-containing protein [Eubacterium sp.]
MMNTEDFLALVRNNKTLIFGAGYVADLLWEALQIHHAADCVTCFMVSRSGEQQAKHGLPVRLLQDVEPSDSPVLVAVHEAGRREVQALLDKAGFHERIFVYPLLHELIYGRPVAEKKIRLKELLAKQNPHHYWLAARLCGVFEQRDLYCRAMAVHSSRHTAEKRYDELQKLKASMSAQGYDQKYPILVDTDFRIIDGLHRTVLAACCGMTEIPARIVKSSPSYDRLLNDRNYLPGSRLAEFGLSAEDASVLRAMQALLNDSDQLCGMTVLPARLLTAEAAGKE